MSLFGPECKDDKAGFKVSIWLLRLQGCPAWQGTLCSSHLPAAASQAAGTTGTQHHTGLLHLSGKLSLSTWGYCFQLDQTLKIAKFPNNNLSPGS